MDARKNLQKQCELYQQNPDENQGEKLKASKEILEKVYLDIADKELTEVIDEIVSSDNKYSHKASWKLVNEVSGRKKARTAKLKGKNVKERLISWYDLFGNLLGSELLADSKDDNVKHTFQNLPIWQPVHHGGI